MICFDRLWILLSQKGVTSYALNRILGISASALQSLKHNKNVSTSTLNKLCTILQCDISDIAHFVPDEEEP